MEMNFRNLLLLASLLQGCLCQNRPDKCVLCRTDHGRNHCDNEDSCDDDEVCYIQQFSTHSGYINHAGCIDHQKCSSIGTHSIYHDSFREDLTAGRCCDTYMCNTKQSLHTSTLTTKPTEKPTTTVKNVASSKQLAQTGVDHCMKCVIERDVKYHCDHHEICKQGQVCFLQEFKFLFQTIYHGGCVKASKCDSVATASFHEDYPGEHVIDGRCCSSNNCNKESIFQQKLTTHMPSTVHKPTTTAQHAVTTQKATGHQCAVCSGQQCDGHQKLVNCPSGFPLCMTTVNNDKQGNKVYEKRCASLANCRTRWLDETTVKPECISFKPTLTYTYDFSCTFCCKVDGCNRDHMPSVDSLYL